MIIQINEIEKDYFDKYVILHPMGEEKTVKEWQRKYGFALIIGKTYIYDIMKEMNSWSCNQFGDCCYFEFG